MKIFNRRDKTLLTVKTYLRYNVFESFGLPFPKTYFWRNFTMKKIIAVVLSLAFVLPLTACNNSGVSQEDLDRLQREIDRLENELNQQETNTPSQTEPTNTPEPTEEPTTQEPTTEEPAPANYTYQFNDTVLYQINEDT